MCKGVHHALRNTWNNIANSPACQRVHVAVCVGATYVACPLSYGRAREKRRYSVADYGLQRVRLAFAGGSPVGDQLQGDQSVSSPQVEEAVRQDRWAPGGDS